MTHHASASIVATVRNERTTIDAFVDSLLQQTRKPDEIIIVDGCSTDGTLEALQSYEARGLIRVISRDCNIAQGRNIGIDAAESDVICVTDAGCRVDPQWLEHFMKCFAEHPDIEVAAGNFRFETHNDFERSVVLATFNPDRDNTPAARYFPSSRSLAFHKAAWARAGGYPEWLYAAEDTLFNIRLRQIGCRFAFCQDAIVRWRPRETWRALARQRLNFSRGNARVGIGLDGYRQNIRTHGIALAGLVVAPVFAPALLVSGFVLARHALRNLVPQARRATEGKRSLFWRTLAVMEYVRLVNIVGYLQGRRDRIRDPRFISEQRRYMGTDCADDVRFED